MEQKHTPGPWKVSRQNPSPTTGEWMISGSKPGYLAEVRDCGSGDVQANARLISAAPELLEIVKSILADDMMQYLPAEYIEKIRSSIAKATGQ